MYCKKCGAELEVNAKECPRCGCVVEEKQTAKSPNSAAIVISGILAIFGGFATLASFSEANIILTFSYCVAEAIFLYIFYHCKQEGKKHQSSPEELQRRAEVEQRRAEIERKRIAERERKRKERELAFQQAREAERLRTTIVSTRLLGAGTAEYKKGVGDMVTRAAVGSMFGVTGAVIGAATAKEKNVNKNVRRFLVKYLDGHVEEKEATIGSSQYKTYMEHLEWAEEER